MRLFVTTAALLLAGTGLLADAAGASAATSSRGPEAHSAAQSFNQIRNAAFSQCIDAPGGALNVQLRLAPCSRSTGTRLWTFVPTGAANTFFVVNRASGFCMEVNNGTSTPGETVDEFTCNGSAAEQWVAEGLTLRHAGTNQCLDTVGGRGSNLMQFTCGQAVPAGAQSWIIE
ncbi:RICIN domain-containing protein [Nucisporomicrobium flavum]|uniref:RICIN domain-containing protein n=1 Tax=Nucisporomicrobium flavum TaxID=2785915 RepID=UPI0018F70956|nr:RICIN domain-containing protein [Nucisporomicrobium flavum]